MRRLRTGRTASALALLLTLSWACGGGSSPTSSGPPPTPTPAPAPTPTATPTTPPVVQGCSAGQGDPRATCFRSQATFLDAINAAIDKVVQQHPEYFNLNDQSAPGAYRVTNENGYLDGVVANLQQAGFCAEPDITRTVIQVKQGNDLSDEYDIFTGNGFINRGQGAYTRTCNPASFPVDPREVIAKVRVALFGQTCTGGVTPPADFITSGKIPLACVGLVTASPKDRDGRDVDPRIHGPYVDWILRYGREVVHTEHWDGQPFNYRLYPLGPIDGYSFCATVQGVEGCLNGEVIP